MPTYDYKCDACGQAWEKVQSIKADPIKTCPHCGQETARRLIGMGAGLIFKGSGFYITDYREKGYADSAKADAAAGGEKAADKAEAKSDAKPEGKPDKPAEGKSADHKPAESKPAESKPAAATPAASPTPTPTAKGES